MQSSDDALHVDADEMRLISSAKAGDSDGFADLYRRYRPRLFSVARQYFAPGNDRDDLNQEATIGFFKAVRDFEIGKGAFGAFVELCVRRQVITFIKTATRLKHQALNQASSLDAPAFADSQEPLANRLPAPPSAAHEAEDENRAFLDVLFSRCSPLEQGILRLYTRGYSFQEMASELGVHWKSIDNAVWRVKVKARKLLADTPIRDMTISRRIPEREIRAQPRSA